MMDLTIDEKMLILLYSPGTRMGLYGALQQMKEQLEEDETELLDLTNSVLQKLPSIDKGKHACQRVFPLLFALFALAGVSPPASQKPKNIRKYIAGRCGAVLPEQKWVQTRKDPQRILAVLSRGLTQYGHISARQNRVCPCQSMVSDMDDEVFEKLSLSLDL